MNRFIVGMIVFVWASSASVKSQINPNVPAGQVTLCDDKYQKLFEIAASLPAGTEPLETVLDASLLEALKSWQNQTDVLFAKLGDQITKPKPVNGALGYVIKFVLRKVTMGFLKDNPQLKEVISMLNCGDTDY